MKEDYDRKLERRAMALADKVFDRIISDKTFSQQLADNPEQALKAAGLMDEFKAIQVASKASLKPPGVGDCRLTCVFFTCEETGCTFSCIFTDPPDWPLKSE